MKEEETFLTKLEQKVDEEQTFMLDLRVKHQQILLVLVLLVVAGVVVVHGVTADLEVLVEVLLVFRLVVVTSWALVVAAAAVVTVVETMEVLLLTHAGLVDLD